MQRRIQNWRATEGSDKEVMLAQRHRPGEAAQTDEDYLAVMRYLGMTPRTTEVAEKEQNGDVEAANRALKNDLEQALLLRGSRDFASRDAWQAFVDDVNRKVNRTGQLRLAISTA